MIRKTVRISSMACSHCAATVRREIEGLKGVFEVEVQFSEKDVVISWDESVLDWNAISSRLSEIGYPADP